MSEKLRSAAIWWRTGGAYHIVTGKDYMECATSREKGPDAINWQRRDHNSTRMGYMTTGERYVDAPEATEIAIREEQLRISVDTFREAYNQIEPWMVIFDEGESASPTNITEGNGGICLKSSVALPSGGSTRTAATTLRQA